MLNTNYKYTSTPYPSNTNNLPKVKHYIKPQKDTISFQGHIGAEKTLKKGYTWLVSETCFFRDSATNNCVKEYILKNFAHKDRIKLISAGCSTGEEAVTWSMLLDGIKDKVEILGFDLSPTNVAKANSRKFIFQRNKNLESDYISRQCSGFSDSYLVFDNQRDLTSQEIEYKRLFSEFFEADNDSLPKVKVPLRVRFNNWLLKKIFKLQPLELEVRQYKVKDNKALNCKFIEGDIMNLENIVGEDKADVIFFKNAIYHLITDNIGACALRRLKPDAASIVEEIASKAQNSLSDKGLFVFGEDEVLQMMDSEVVPRIMRKLGFKPIIIEESSIPNIWQKS